MNGESITIDNDTLAAEFAGLQSFTNGTLTVIGVTVNLPDLTDIDDSNFSVESSGDLEMPAVSDYTNDDYYDDGLFSATGGGTLNLSGLTTTSGYYGVTVTATGTGSLVNLSGLTSIATPYSGTTFTATGGGTIELASGLTDLDDVSVTVDSPTAIVELVSGVPTSALSRISTFTDGSITLIGPGSFELGMSSLDGTSLYAQNGASVNVDVSTYSASGPSDYYNEPTFDATGGGTLDFLNLGSIAGYYGVTVIAQGTDQRDRSPGPRIRDLYRRLLRGR